MIVAGLLTAILVLLCHCGDSDRRASSLDGLRQRVEHWHREWVQLRRDDPGRVLGSLHE
jgi:hypothetical protein